VLKKARKRPVFGDELVTSLGVGKKTDPGGLGADWYIYFQLRADGSPYMLVGGVPWKPPVHGWHEIEKHPSRSEQPQLGALYVEVFTAC
jgi:hypothetical protein